MRHVLTLFLSFLLLLTFVRLFKWEIPITISGDYLAVIGGFPTFIERVYEDALNMTLLPDDVIIKRDTEVIRKNSGTSMPQKDSIVSLPWECHQSVGDSGVCESILTKERCSANSQYSTEFWQSANKSCRRLGATVTCTSPSLDGTECLNVVQRVEERNRTLVFDLSTAKISSPVVQFYANVTDYRTNCYYPGDTVVLSPAVNRLIPGSNGKCISTDSTKTLDTRSGRIQFGTNTSITCWSSISPNQSCDSVVLELMREMEIDAVHAVCGCGDCDIVMMRSEPPLQDENSSCLIPSGYDVTFSYSNGRVTGALTRYTWQPITRQERWKLEMKYVFVPHRSKSSISRFDLQRGRFHCPSDVTCLKELWYPISDWTTLQISHQIAFLVISLVLSFVFLCNTNKV